MLFERNWVKMWFVIMVSLYGSLVVWNMDSKAKRISRIMVPASQIEKFLFGAVLVLVVMPVAVLFAIEIFDVLRVVTFRYAIDTPCRDLVSFMNVPQLIVEDVNPPGFVVALLTTQSVFVLGSSIWHRKPLIKTIVACVAVIFTTVWTMVLIGPIHNDYIRMSENIGIIISIAVIAINWSLAYYIFSRSQVIGRIIDRR